MTRILHTQFKFTKNAIACDLFMLKYKISFAWFEFNLEKRTWVHTSSRICLYGKRVIAWQEEIWSHMVKYLATIPFQNIICSRILSFFATFYLPAHTITWNVCLVWHLLSLQTIFVLGISVSSFILHIIDYQYPLSRRNQAWEKKNLLIYNITIN